MINELKWLTLTALVNEIRAPNGFLKSLLWSGTPDLLTTDTIVLDTISRGREVAPFVRAGAEGIMVGGYSSNTATVSGPNIRIKRPFTPSELLYGRRPGTNVMIQPNDQMSAIQAHIARDMQGMENMVQNAEEWLCAMALTQTIAYSVVDSEVITITYPRSSANSITLSTFWNDATPANVRVLNDIHAVKRVMTAVGVTPTDAICGTEASDALRSLIEGGHVKTLVQNFGQVTVGGVDFTTQFNDQGVIYLGTIGGVRFWEYGRTASVNGTATSMIRPKFIEFVNTNNEISGRQLVYAAIPDMELLEGRTFQGRRFAKSWTVPDPSAKMALLHSRPLPLNRRPDTMVSVKVVSG